jgi:hypothetical protein
MNNNIILVSIAFLIIGFFFGFIYSGLNSQSPELTLTGQVISENVYTYTTAICNDKNECIDVLVECENGDVISLTPTSNLLDLGKGFEDFRDKPETFCE